MEPRVSLITLGVKDLDAALRFYQDGLGWSAQRQDDVAFFQLNNLILSLYPKHKLAEDACVKPEGTGFGGITLAHNVASDKEVDETLAAAKKAGAKIMKKGQKVFWGGYSGYFADPDGYLWEVAHNPFWKMAKDGSVKL